MIGVLGGGQLGRMLGLAAARLGEPIRFFDSSPDAPAQAVGEFICAPFDDEKALRRFAQGCDVVTYEFENVPTAAARLIEEVAPVRPSVAALQTAQDRALEKALFRDLGFPTARFALVDDGAALQDAAEAIGAPSILKTRREGYDGKGQARLRSVADADGAWDAVGRRPAVLEEVVRFERELSIVAARGLDGEFRAYPLAQNTHRDGILRRTEAPAVAEESLRERAEQLAREVMERLRYVGVIAIELFDAGDALLANEIAPRVHNSGHWTIEGARTDQFENHLRAVLGLPLGPTAPRGHSVMINVIGRRPDIAAALREGACVHMYGKAERAGRKIGHITLVGEDRAGIRQRADALAARLGMQ